MKPQSANMVKKKKIPEDKMESSGLKMAFYRGISAFDEISFDKRREIIHNCCHIQLETGL